MKKCCLFLLLFATLLAPVGCAEAKSTVELYPYTQDVQPSVDKTGLVVNVSTHKIHFDPDCYHIKSAKEENLRYTAHTSDTVNTLFSMDYALCETCSK